MQFLTRADSILCALVCAAAILVGSDASADAEEVLAATPPEIRQKLADQSVVMLEEVGGDGPESFLVAMVEFKSSRDRVLDLLREAERQPEYRTELKKVRTVETLADGRVDEQELKILFKTLTYRLRYREDPETGRLTWSLDKDFDNDIALMDGFWELYPYQGDPDRTLGRFGSNVDVGKGVPSFVQKGMSRKTVVRYLRNLQQWVDSDGAWRP